MRRPQYQNPNSIALNSENAKTAQLFAVQELLEAGVEFAQFEGPETAAEPSENGLETAPSVSVSRGTL